MGGAVRDQLMGLPVKERDWVVVGASPEEMGALGFRPVGRDFPVFLHPKTNEEYALARTERKTGPGYHGFVFSSSPDVTLEQDLLRRDLTMNAIAMDGQGKLVDPLDGSADIAAGVIRHVADAFREDPVRVLRVAKFAARFHCRGFRIDPATMQVMAEMAEQGEVDALVAERVWQEMNEALQGRDFYRFIEVLRECSALQSVMPEVDRLYGVPQVEKYHPEIDTGVHTIMSLQAAGQITDDPMVMFAVLVHDLGKGLTPENELPRHRGHERSGIKPIRELCARMAVPAAYRDFALKVCEFHLHGHRIRELRADTVLKLLESLDAFRRPQRVSLFIDCCLADKRGRTGHENDSRETLDILQSLFDAAQSVDTAEIAERTARESHASESSGKQIGQAIRSERIRVIGEARKSLGL